MIIVKIILGLIALGIVVFVHELGHFLAARLVGIDVDAFSIGWGKPVLKKKIGKVEYRLGIFPIGGYCKMAGDDKYEEAWEAQKNGKAPKEGTFYAAPPYKRIIVAFAGPFFNVLLAVVLFAVIWGVGFEYETLDNKIVLVKDVDAGESYPADKAGLETGDKIVAIGGRDISDYRNIQSVIAVNAERELPVTVIRDGKELNLNIEPELQKSSGVGKIGVYPYVEPYIGYVAPGSPAEKAGLQKGDLITKINGAEIPYTMALYRIFKDGEIPSGDVQIEYKRAGELYNTEIFARPGQAEQAAKEVEALEQSYEGELEGAGDVGKNANEAQVAEEEFQNFGIEWQTITQRTPKYSFFGAAGKGFQEAYYMLEATIRSFRLLFRGIDLTQSVSGPARITWLAGEVATQGFSQSVWEGVRSLANFLALISIALGVTNLLPLPVLDGGLIVLFLIEIARRKAPSPKALQAFQIAGFVLIVGLMVFSIAGDIMFFARR